MSYATCGRCGQTYQVCDCGHHAIGKLQDERNGLRAEVDRLRKVICSATGELAVALERLEGESVRSIVAERAHDDVDGAYQALRAAVERRPPPSAQAGEGDGDA